MSAKKTKKAAKRPTRPADHRENIFTACDRHTADLVSARENDDGESLSRWEDESILEIDALRGVSDPDRYRVRFVLQLNGPTVDVTVDSVEGCTYEHSWGKAADARNARDLTRIHLSSNQRSAWEALAEEVMERSA